MGIFLYLFCLQMNYVQLCPWGLNTDLTDNKFCKNEIAVSH